MATITQPIAVPRPTTGPDLRALVGVAAVLLGTLTSLLNARLTDIGLADLRGALGVGMDEASWVTTAYLVAEVAAIPSAVWLRSILSPARGVLLGALIFTIASLAAPFSPSLNVLICAQAIRGLSAGVLIPMAYAVVMRHLPQHLRLYGLSLYALVSALTPSVAVWIEGWIVSHLSWEYLFWINVVPGGLTLLAGAYGLASEPIRFLRFRRHDAFGLLALSLGLAALVAALDQGNRLDWLESGLIVGLGASSALLLTAYVGHALRHSDPVVSVRLLARRNIGLGLLLMFVMRVALMSSAFLLPQYLVHVQGYRSLESGSLFLLSALPQVLLAPLVARLCYAIDPRNLLAFGMILYGAGVLMMSNLTHLWAADQIMPALLVQSIAAPFTAVPLMVLITEDISVPEIPWIASLVHIVRTVGTAIGLASIGTLTRVREQVHSSLLGLHVEKGTAETQGRIDAFAQFLDPHAAGSIDAVAQSTVMLARTVQREALVLAYIDSFTVIGLGLLGAGLVTLFMRRPPLPGRFL